MVRSREAITNLSPDPETRAVCLSQLSVPSRPSAAADWGVSPAVQPAGTSRYDPRGSGPTRMSSPIHGGATHSAGENTTPPGCSRPLPAQLSPVHCVCAERHRCLLPSQAGCEGGGPHLHTSKHRVWWVSWALATAGDQGSLTTPERQRRSFPGPIATAKNLSFSMYMQF